MSQAESHATEPASVRVAVPVTRTTWTSRPATLHYEGGRLVRADGTDLTATGRPGLTGVLYVVTDSICRDNRAVMRVERRRIIDGRVVDVRNWGEVEDVGPQAAA